MLLAFDPRRSYLQGPRLGCHKKLGFDPRTRYLSGMGDEPTMYDPGNTLIPPVYSAPDLPLILVPSSAGDPSIYDPSSALTPPSGSSGSAAGAISAAASAAAAALAARNQAAIVNPSLLHSTSFSQQIAPYIPYMAIGLAAVVLLSSGKKRR